MSTPTATDFAALGIVLPAGPRAHVRTTCPVCSESRRKRRNRCLVVTPETGLFYCHHCHWKGKAGGTASRPALPTTRPPATPDEQHRRRLQRTWDTAHPLDPGDPVMRYLTQRGLTLPANQIPPVLRYHPQLRYLPDDETESRSVHPGLVARIDDAHGRPINLHRTYLTRTGQKAAVATVRKLMSPVVEGGTKGSAIRLYRPGDTLAITEGIETALAVHLMSGLPTWAAVCANMMEAVVLPALVQLVVICADHDDNQVGLTAAQSLAERLLAEGRRVKICLPTTAGTDWLDVFTDPQADLLTLARIAATPDVSPAHFNTPLTTEISKISNFSRGGPPNSTSLINRTGTSYGLRLAASVARYKRQLYADPYFGADARRAKGIPVARLIQKETPHE